MNLNDRKVEEQTVDPYAILKETDGFIVVGYLKGSHDKFAQFYSTDRDVMMPVFSRPVNE